MKPDCAAFRDQNLHLLEEMVASNRQPSCCNFRATHITNIAEHEVVMVVLSWRKCRSF